MKKISLICCYTDKKQLDELMTSLKDVVNYNIEWINIDNSNNRFNSCSKALNYGYTLSSGEIVVFLHQDIVFSDIHELDIIVNNALEGRVVGVAGRKDTGGPVYSCIFDGLEHIQHYHTFSEKSITVLTCDECLIAMNRTVYELLEGFDEVTFDGWHFYGVDISLKAHLHGIQCVVVPVPLWHKSKGNLDRKWHFYEKRLAKKYRTNFKVIYYPCGRCYTNPVKYIVASTIRPLYKKIEKYRRIKG